MTPYFALVFINRELLEPFEVRRNIEIRKSKLFDVRLKSNYTTLSQSREIYRFNEANTLKHMLPLYGATHKYFFSVCDTNIFFQL